ncbi:MAG: CBS domain-containing protein [Alphaproteobacteria bacterium]|nr:CBS domain-containing protein [Alphaproteobacteria bacterium]
MTRRPIVADYMATDLVTLPPEMEINRATAILLEKGYSGAPVVDGAMKLVGVLSKKDCLRAALNASYYQEWGGSVADYMSADVETLDADLDLVQAAERFLESNYRRFPVMRGGRLVGQISRADLLRAIAEQWRADRLG